MINDADFEKFSLIGQGHSAFQLMWAGVELRVFEYLAKKPGAKTAQVAKQLKIEQQPAQILLRGLAALGLIKVSRDSYKNSELAKKYLVRKSPINMVEVLGWQRYIVYPGVTDFIESLKQNTNVGLRHFPGDEPALYPRLSHDPKLEDVFQKAMTSLSSANNQMLVKYLNVSNVKHLVDGGGGDGTNALMLARKSPSLRVTVFDLPSIAERAKANIAKYKEKSRVDVHTGDMFKDAFPEADGILFAHMLTIWSPEKDTELLRRAYAALPPGGKVFIFNMFAHDDGAGPISSTVGSVYFMSIATGKGMLYTFKEQISFLKNAGFKKIEKHVLPHAHGILIGTK